MTDEHRPSIDDLDNIGMGPACPICGRDTSWLRCTQIGCHDGIIDDLYERDPLWYDEDDWEWCEECQGHGGWHYCDECNRYFEWNEWQDENETV
jgi:hypothetical protein